MSGITWVITTRGREVLLASGAAESTVQNVNNVEVEKPPFLTYMLYFVETSHI